MEPELPDDILPAPLVPAEVDLTDFAFMPLFIHRLLRSEFWVESSVDDPLVAAVSVTLWATAWHEVPAGSIPDNDTLLARSVGLPKKEWLDIRDRVLAQWVKCSDGRWYHPVVAERALAAWTEKESYRARTEEFSKRQAAKARARWEKSKSDATADATADAVGMPRHSHGNAEPMPMKERGIGKGIGKKDIDMSEADASDPSDGVLPLDLPDHPAPPPEPSEGYTGEFLEWWAIYPRKDGKGHAFRAFQKAKKRAPLPKIMAGVKAYAKRRKGQDPAYTKLPTTWLNGDCWNDEPDKNPMGGGYVPMGVGG